MAQLHSVGFDVSSSIPQLEQDCDIILSFLSLFLRLDSLHFGGRRVSTPSCDHGSRLLKSVKAMCPLRCCAAMWCTEAVGGRDSVSPSRLFHCSWECLLAKLERAEKHNLVKYVKTSLLQKKGDCWTATWQSSFEQCEVGYSTFASNCQESKWAADQLLAGRGASHELIPTLLDRINQQTLCWHRMNVEVLPSLKVLSNRLLVLA